MSDVDKIEADVLLERLQEARAQRDRAVAALWAMRWLARAALAEMGDES